MDIEKAFDFYVLEDKDYTEISKLWNYRECTSENLNRIKGVGKILNP
jgi:hypothetical protein